MKKNVRWIVGIGLAVLFAFIYAHIDKVTFLYDRNIDPSSFLNTGVLVDDQVSQTFLCNENILDGFQVKCSSVGDSQNVKINYSVEELRVNKTVVSGSFNGSDVKGNKFYEIKFPQIKNCSGKEYRVTFEEIGSDELNGVAFYLVANNEETISIGYMEFKGEKDADLLLALRTLSHRFDFETFGVVILFMVYIVAFSKLLYKLFK